MKSYAKLMGTLVIAFAAGISANANAISLLGEAPPSSLIVNAGGYEWVYAAPCAGSNPSCGSVTLHHGFQFATAEQWNASFASIAELAAAFKPGNDVLCAAAYFSNEYDHCDFGNVEEGYIWNSPLVTDDYARSPIAETFLIRVGAADVPEPASISLIALGLAGFAAARRKLRK